MSPSNQSYIKITYSTIIEVIKKVKNEKPNKIIPQVIEYTKLLEREFMEESEISKLTKQIYSQHKKAVTCLFDFVSKQEINEWIKDLIKQHNFILDNCKGKYFIRFIPKDMDLEEIKKGNPKDRSRWSDVNRIILFEFGVNCDRDNKIYLSLMMGPGNEELRQKLYSIILRNKSIFTPSSSLQDDFCSLHDVFEIEKTDTKSIEELEEEIEQKFNEFSKNSLPKIVNAFKKEFKKEDLN